MGMCRKNREDTAYSREEEEQGSREEHEKELRTVQWSHSIELTLSKTSKTEHCPMTPAPGLTGGHFELYQTLDHTSIAPTGNVPPCQKTDPLLIGDASPTLQLSLGSFQRCQTSIRATSGYRTPRGALDREQEQKRKEQVEQIRAVLGISITAIPRKIPQEQAGQFHGSPTSEFVILPCHYNGPFASLTISFRE